MKKRLLLFLSIVCFQSGWADEPKYQFFGQQMLSGIGVFSEHIDAYYFGFELYWGTKLSDSFELKLSIPLELLESDFYYDIQNGSFQGPYDFSESNYLVSDFFTSSSFGLIPSITFHTNTSVPNTFFTLGMPLRYLVPSKEAVSYYPGFGRAVAEKPLLIGLQGSLGWSFTQEINSSIDFRLHGSLVMNIPDFSILERNMASQNYQWLISRIRISVGTEFLLTSKTKDMDR
jgi:hypothetical protein